MATKKSLEIGYDVNGTEVRLHDRVAYAHVNYAGFKPVVHTGTVERITDEGFWIRPDEKFADDACQKKVYPIVGYSKRYGTDYPVYDYTKGTESKYYHWYWRNASRCLKL